MIVNDYPEVHIVKGKAQPAILGGLRGAKIKRVLLFQSTIDIHIENIQKHKKTPKFRTDKKIATSESKN